MRTDFVVAAVLTAVSQIELWSTEQLPELDDGNGRAWFAAVLAIMTGSVVARRRAPLLATGIAAGAFAVMTLLVKAVEVYSTLNVLMFSVFSVAAYATRWRAGVGLTLAMGVLYLEDDADWILGAAIFGTVWLAGRAVRSHRLLAGELATKVADLERERERSRRLTMAEERARIAREVHDVLAHTVSVMVVQAEAAEELLHRDQERTQQRLVAIQTTGREALGEIRHLVGILRNDEPGSDRSPQPGLGQVQELVEEFRRLGLPVTVTIEGDAKQLPPGLDLCAYRLVQEGLTNTLKHAGPATASVAIHYGRDDLELDVQDDGCGADQIDAGHGLTGIRERVSLYGGNVQIATRRDGGFTIHAQLPYEEPIP